MTKKKVQLEARERLMNWYGNNKRSLPWRKTADPYLIWVSEVMLQQTQVATVVEYYRRFVRMYPTIKDLSEAGQNRVLKAWEGLGYYTRARNFHKASQIVASRYNGHVPDTWNEFRGLPGVGDYIASAVLSIAFGQPYAVVDGNVKRVLSRLFQMDSPVNTSSSVGVFRVVAQQMLDTSDPGTFNQAVMELGALVCKPRQPLCGECPLETCCSALGNGSVADFPKRKKKKPVPEKLLVTGIVEKKGKVLIVQRNPDHMLGGLWEFPGGEVKKKEDGSLACKNRIREQTGIQVSEISYLTRVRHAYSHFKIQMDVFHCHFGKGPVKLNGPVACKWVNIEDLDQFPFHKAVHKFLSLVKAKELE